MCRRGELDAAGNLHSLWEEQAMATTDVWRCGSSTSTWSPPRRASVVPGPAGGSPASAADLDRPTAGPWHGSALGEVGPRCVSTDGREDLLRVTVIEGPDGAVKSTPGRAMCCSRRGDGPCSADNRHRRRGPTRAAHPGHRHDCVGGRRPPPRDGNVPRVAIPLSRRRPVARAPRGGAPRSPVCAASRSTLRATIPCWEGPGRTGG